MMYATDFQIEANMGKCYQLFSMSGRFMDNHCTVCKLLRGNFYNKNWKQYDVEWNKIGKMLIITEAR